MKADINVASGDVAYERVVDAIDVAQGAGASRIGLTDEPDRGTR
jgi:hypothetical protein